MHLFQTYKIFSILFILLFIPPFFNVLFDFPSMAGGVFFTMLYILSVSKINFPIYTLDLKILFFWLAAFILHFVSIYVDFDNKKLLSFFLIGLLFLTAAILSVEIRKLNSIHMLAVLKICTIVILFFGCLSLFWKVTAFGYERHVKSVFPFMEPSHFAITIGSFLFTVGLYLSAKMRIYLISILILMAILYPSLILLTVSFAMLCFYFTTRAIYLILFLIFLLLNFYLTDIADNASYFIDRLTFDGSNTRNQTTLVYLQGWEDLKICLHESYGFGVGFQNMGILSPGEYGEIISQIAGGYKNRNDGGFLVAKIIGEFGFLGFALVLGYLFKFFKSANFIIKFIKLTFDNNQKINKYPVWLIFGHSIIIMFFIEMFGRGYGYFSSGVFLFFTSIFLTSTHNKKSN